MYLAYIIITLCLKRIDKHLKGKNNLICIQVHGTACSKEMHL